MAFLLNIDTATEIASVCLSENGNSIGFEQNQNHREHASFIHEAIAGILKNSGKKLNDVDAIAITAGPGSYTGLRVGMATAKGLCYALNKPLIAISTLEVMAKAAIDSVLDTQKFWYCPMIDARRDEVFLALYNAGLKKIEAPQPVILTENFFAEYREKPIVFFGSGSKKIKNLSSFAGSVMENIESNAKNLGQLAEIAFNHSYFADLAYLEPDYCKNFFETKTNQKS